LENGDGLGEIEKAQRVFCDERGASYVASLWEAMSGFAISTAGKIPLNGLRHPAGGGTTGWYIWCGEQASDAPDFYVPLHTLCLYELYPEIAKLFGLQPGYRFLLAPDYLDIWFDASLLQV
jgi:hypothetical protein